MDNERSRSGDIRVQEQKSWPVARRELTLRHVLSSPAHMTQDGGVRPAGAPAQKNGEGRAQSASRTVRLEIVVDAHQFPWLLELLRDIFVIRARRRRTPPAAPAPTRALPATLAFGLTPREEEVLGQMMEGKSNRQIALDLEITAATVKCHVSNILSKMGAESRTKAVAMALQQPSPCEGA